MKMIKKLGLINFYLQIQVYTRNKVIRFISQRKVKVNGIVVKKASILLKYKDEIIIDSVIIKLQKKI